MKHQEEATSLLKYIESLAGFNFVRPELQPPYGNMGATITDAILQAGTNWSTVVKPRLKKLLERNDAQTTDGFLDLLISEGSRQVLDWGNTIKPKRIHRLANLLSNEGVQTEGDLKVWLQNEKNIDKLKCVDGIGNKTIDYLKILSGLSAIAVDRHIIKFLQKAGMDIEINQYERAREIVCETATALNIDLSILDHSIWSYMSTKPKPRNICEKTTLREDQNDVELPFCDKQIGPYGSKEIVLCSADAGPTSQKSMPDQAQFFYPKAKWIGALRNTASKNKTDFVILTTAFGFAIPNQVIEPYDMHVNCYPIEIECKWRSTLINLMTDKQWKMMVFYAGGCPRDEMLKLMIPILYDYKVSLLTFGRPNMYDVDKVGKIVRLLMQGTSILEIHSLLKVPGRLKYYPIK